MQIESRCNLVNELISGLKLKHEQQLTLKTNPKQQAHPKTECTIQYTRIKLKIHK